jgi:hypothetical protein
MGTAVSEAPLGRRVNVERRGYDHVRLGRFIARPQVDWEPFVASWDDLPPDQYIKPPHPGRFRRYGAFRFDRSSDSLEPLPTVPFFQSTELNSYAGGIHRLFAPLAETTPHNAVLRATLYAGLAAFVDLDDTRRWDIGVHQIRVLGRSDQPGSPTPEGNHRDGFDFVAMHIVNRRNVTGGETILQVDGNESRALLLEPLETVFVDDRRCYHGASPISPTDPAELAVRDTLIVTYHVVAR